MLATILVVVVVTWHDRFGAGSVGVSLVLVITFSEILTRLVENWTKLESSIGAVKRIKQFKAETESEDITGRVNNAALEWPQMGSLEFTGMSASYR